MKKDLQIYDELEVVFNKIIEAISIVSIAENAGISTIITGRNGLLIFDNLGKTMRLQNGMIVTINDYNYVASNIIHQSAFDSFDISTTDLIATEFNVACNFQTGTRTEINEILNEQNSDANRFKKFPLVWWIYSDIKDYSSEVLDFTSTINLAFAYKSNKTDRTAKRIDENISIILQPIIKLFKLWLQSSDINYMLEFFGQDKPINDKQTTFAYYGNDNEEVLSISTDAIELEVDLNFKKQYEYDRDKPTPPLPNNFSTYHKTITDNVFAESIENLPAKFMSRVALLNGDTITFSGDEIADIHSLIIKYSDGSWNIINDLVSLSSTITGLWQISGTDLIIGNDGSNFFTGQITRAKGYDISNQLIFESILQGNEYEYDLVNSNHGTWTGTGDKFTYDLEGSTYLNENGYSSWEHATLEDIQVPFEIEGNALVLTSGVDIPSGYTKTRDIVAGSTRWNMQDALIDFDSQGTGVTLIENGEFLDASSWTLSPNWTINLGEAIFDGIVNNNILNQKVVHVEIGEIIEFTFTISGSSATLSFINHLGQLIISANRYDIGTHIIQLPIVQVTTSFGIRAYTASGGFSIDNIIIKRVLPFSIFDKSNTTRQTAISRASDYYDATHPYRYHVNEIADFAILNSFFEALYVDTLFAKILKDESDIIRLDEVLNYETQKTGEDLLTIKEYCNI